MHTDGTKEPTTAARLGAEGERAATEWLRAHGFLIMDRNWRMGRYELDIVASHGDTIHFVEVKLRRAGGVTAPEEAMTAAKERALLHAANAYIEAFGITLDCQIDLIAIDYAPDDSYSLRYIPNAAALRW